MCCEQGGLGGRVCVCTGESCSIANTFSTMDVQRLTLLKRKLEALNYDGELDPKSAPLAEKVRRRSKAHTTPHLPPPPKK